MLKVKKLGVILELSSLGFENLAVLNPGIWKEGDSVHILYRAIDKDNRSSVGYARLEGPTKVVERWNKPIIKREFIYEDVGVEDPRIVKIGDTFYIFYVAYDGNNALTAYATSSDLKTFKKKGIISPQIPYREAATLFRKANLKDAYFYFSSFYEKKSGEEVLLWGKDIFLFPKKINGKFALLQRILPDIQIVFFNDFSELTTEFWKDYIANLSDFVLLENKHWFETRNIGGGCPPIETKDGWLIIFHTVEERNQGRVYHACAALLDKKDPRKVIGRLHEPLFSPEETWETEGLVSNVVFPTGTALFDDELHIYYGAADKRIAVVSVSLSKLLAEMQDVKKGHNYGKKSTT